MKLDNDNDNENININKNKSVNKGNSEDSYDKRSLHELIEEQLDNSKTLYKEINKNSNFRREQLERNKIKASLIDKDVIKDIKKFTGGCLAAFNCALFVALDLSFNSFKSKFRRNLLFSFLFLSGNFMIIDFSYYKHLDQQLDFSDPYANANETDIDSNKNSEYPKH